MPVSVILLGTYLVRDEHSVTCCKMMPMPLMRTKVLLCLQM